MSEHDEGFYYCLKHHRVEGHEGCADKDRLGPYPTAAEAAVALETVAAREARYEAEEKAEGEGEGEADWR